MKKGEGNSAGLWLYPDTDLRPHTMPLDAILPFTKELASKLGEVVSYTLYDEVEDPVAVDIKEDEDHLYVEAIGRSQLVK
jgi:hypothetical protein